MRVGKRKIRVLAAALTAGILFSMQGLTVYAGTTGLGSAAGENGGPGVEARQEQTDQGEAGQEQQGQGETGQEQQPGRPDSILQVNYSGFGAAQAGLQ